MTSLKKTNHHWTSISFCVSKIWVVWNMFYFSMYWECHHPNWRGVGSTSDQLWSRGSPTVQRCATDWRIPHHLWAAASGYANYRIILDTLGDSTRFYHWDLKNTCLWWCLIWTYIWVNLITTSLFSLTGIMVSKGNHPHSWPHYSG